MNRRERCFLNRASGRMRGGVGGGEKSSNGSCPLFFTVWAEVVELVKFILRGRGRD